MVQRRAPFGTLPKSIDASARFSFLLICFLILPLSARDQKLQCAVLKFSNGARTARFYEADMLTARTT